MAEIRKLHAKVEARAELVLDEVELRALDALAGYGADSFIAAFYKVMGEHYLRPHEAGLRSFLEAVRDCASLARDANECREFLAQTNRERLEARRHSNGGMSS